MVIGEFERTWNGIWLPPGKIAKRFQPERVYRVLWKIVRGLTFHEAELIFPERHYTAWKIFTEEDPPRNDELVGRMLATTGLGEHPEILRHWKLDTEIKGRQWYARVLLFWNSIMFLAVHHEAACDCEKCGSHRSDESGKPCRTIRP